MAADTTSVFDCETSTRRLGRSPNLAEDLSDEAEDVYRYAVLSLGTLSGLYCVGYIFFIRLNPFASLSFRVLRMCHYVLGDCRYTCKQSLSTYPGVVLRIAVRFTGFFDLGDKAFSIGTGPLHRLSRVLLRVCRILLHLCHCGFGLLLLLTCRSPSPVKLLYWWMPRWESAGL